MILYSRWLELPIHIRHKIANDFGIIKKGPTHVLNNEILSDGFIIKEVETALNVVAMQAHLNSTETDMAKLFETLVHLAEFPHDARVPIIEPTVEAPIESPIIPKRTYAKRKKSK